MARESGEENGYDLLLETMDSMEMNDHQSTWGL